MMITLQDITIRPAQCQREPAEKNDFNDPVRALSTSYLMISRTLVPVLHTIHRRYRQANIKLLMVCAIPGNKTR